MQIEKCRWKNLHHWIPEQSPLLYIYQSMTSRSRAPNQPERPELRYRDVLKKKKGKDNRLLFPKSIPIGGVLSFVKDVCSKNTLRQCPGRREVAEINGKLLSSGNRFHPDQVVKRDDTVGQADWK
ncbi:hypothetical protein CEXT_319571 [Caerostris extrusa]|uniref:Ribosomal protein S4 n=1 Tax=Caerostris extrusa TaxID=172846 RepID=A0AAV4P2G0_CAEEX|nr:hypothetical protein CEXT_319571 [Caerostris extrusa]